MLVLPYRHDEYLQELKVPLETSGPSSSIVNFKEFPINLLKRHKTFLEYVPMTLRNEIVDVRDYYSKEKHLDFSFIRPLEKFKKTGPLVQRGIQSCFLHPIRSQCPDSEIFFDWSDLDR